MREFIPATTGLLLGSTIGIISGTPTFFSQSLFWIALAVWLGNGLLIYLEPGDWD